MQTEQTNGGILETWEPAEVCAALDDNRIVLIDVRTPPEYMFEHVAGALLMPMAFFDAEKLPGQSDKRIVLHCGSGARSEKMAQAAIGIGIDRIAHLGGGFGAWKEAGLPYIGTDMNSGAPKQVDGDRG